MFRQTVTSGTSWQRAADEWSENPTDPTNDQYSILDTLEKFRMADGRFLFRLRWPELANPFASGPGDPDGNQTWCTWRPREPILAAAQPCSRSYIADAHTRAFGRARREQIRRATP
jgi:hypothetical protein